jgi:amino acid adenylation domain-containing protein
MQTGKELQGYILSPQQKRLLSLHEGLEHRPFITQIEIALTGNINDQLLEQALQKIIDRHSIFRTTFHSAISDDLPLQVIAPDRKIELERIDLSGYNKEERGTKVDELWLSRKESIFDLATGPLSKFALITLDSKSYLLLVTFSSLIADLITTKLFVKELADNYSEVVSSFDEPIQYIQYAEYQSEWIKSDDAQVNRLFWKDSCQLPSITLPFENCVKDSSEFKLQSIRVEPGINIERAIKSFTSKAAELSIENYLLTCWQVLLYRLSLSDRIVTSVYSSGRTFDDIANIPGLFSRHLPVGISIDPKESFLNTWRRASENLMACIENQEGFDSDLKDNANALWFNNSFELIKLPLKITKQRIGFNINRLFSCSDRFKIRLSSVKSDEDLNIAIDYDASLFSRDTIELISSYLKELIRSTTENPHLLIEEIPLVGMELRERIIKSWNSTSETVDNRSVTELILDVATKTPHALAIEHGDNRLTYEELIQRSALVARALQERGIGLESIVGISAHLSIDTVVGIVGILRAGAAYLPLDPTYPPERLHFMVKDADIKLLLITADTEFDLPSNDAEIVYIDQLEEIYRSTSKNGLNPILIHPQNAAYVIYTSGSTGQPKGAVINHAGLTNYLNWCMTRYNNNQSKSVPLHSSLSFDLSITSLFGPLVLGKSIVLPDANDRVEGLSKLLKKSKDHAWIKLTPSHLKLLSKQMSKEEIRNCTRRLIVGGEALTKRDISYWQHASPETTIVNEYGPTETVVGCSVYALHYEEVTPESIPIGRPIANMEMFILDTNMEPVPPGVTGEIYIGGIGLCRGYLNRPGITAEKFIPNPHSSVAGTRLYRSGDLGRYRLGGIIEYLGRSDQQVKVRGYRIELEEIQLILNQYPGIREVVVVNVKSEDESEMLVAYIVPEGEGSADLPATVSELRSFMESKLPEFMVPNMYVPLESLPLTPNGKVDRSALPAPDRDEMQAGLTYSAPRTLEEEVLVAIWSNVLGLEKVGIDDSYFLLGGDSIRAIQVVGQAAARGLEFSLEDLFRHRTIRQLARAIRASRVNLPSLVEIEPFSLISEEDRRRLPEDIEDAYPLSRLQAGMVFHREYHPESAIYHDIFGYHIRMPLDVEKLDEAARQVVARHPALRTSFHLSGYSEPLQLVHKTAPSPLHVTDISHLSSEEQDQAIRAWMEEEKRIGFDYSSPPLVKYQVHIRSAETLQFSLSFHHAVIDGWSDATMLVQVAVSYYYLLMNRTPPFKPPATLYRDFIALERESLDSEEHRSFWLNRMRGASPLVLPRWLPVPVAAPSTRGVYMEPVRITEEVSTKLQKLAKSMAVPLKNVLLAVHMYVMSRLGGTSDVLTTISSSGRPETLDGDKVLGLHLNSAPFRLELQGGTWRDLIHKSFDAERDALPFRRFPMSEIQKMVGSRRLSETSFYYTHYHIVDRLDEFPDFEVLDRMVYEETSFAMVANFSLDPWTDQVTLALACDLTQFGDEQMKAMAGYYERALEALADSPDSYYEEVNLLSEVEKRKILKEFNPTSDLQMEARSIVELIEGQARSNPQEIALKCGDVLLTYTELNRRANQLANRLQKLGVVQDDVVALLFNRSAEMIIGILGVLKAGAAYLPLDPEYPVNRLQFMLEDSQSKVLLTHNSYENLLKDYEIEVFSLDKESSSLSTEPEENLRLDIDKDSLAYLIYTSGSTGQPKGTLISHQNLLASTQSRFEIYKEPLTSFLLLPSYAFDSSVAGIFWTLSTGGKLVIPMPGMQRDPEAIINLVHQHEVSHILCLPSVYEAIVTESRERPMQSLRVAIVAGEACPTSLPAKHAEAVSWAKLYNEYGPTEATVWSSVDCLSDGKEFKVDAPIGVPVPNAQLYVLDSSMEPTPIGVAGELYIGGDGISRGYLNHAGLTAGRFLPDPFSEREGSRVYKTGDRVRYSPDGKLEFLGRVDQQVKIRGYRIELTEIESVLMELPEILEAVVIVHTEAELDKRLVAYLGIPGLYQPSVADLRSYLKERLPEHMIPSSFIFLDSLPRNPNGKIDRLSLPAPEAKSIEREGEIVEPRDEKERVLASIWSDVLRVKAISVFDDFFELGGDSILSIQIIARAKEAGLRVTPNQLFEYRTIAKLASVAEVVQRHNGDRDGTHLNEEEMEDFLSKI